MGGWSGRWRRLMEEVGTVGSRLAQEFGNI
jgi:hypothetical protein